MKVKIEDLKLALDRVTELCQPEYIDIDSLHPVKLYVTGFDLAANEVKVIVYKDGVMMPKIMKTEVLK